MAASTNETVELDGRIRAYVYDRLLTEGRMPLAVEAASRMDLPEDEVRMSLRRLHDAHILVLQGATDEILMANPFSAVPTPFVVEGENRSWWGNCIWDALGIAAMTGEDVTVHASCGDCNDAMTIHINSGIPTLEQGEGIIHFAVPAKRWWDNIKFT